MFNIAIVEPIHPEAIELINNEKKFTFELVEKIDENNLFKQLEKCDAIALRTAKLSAKVINNCKQLKIISRHGVGYDNVDLSALNRKKIALTITIHANAVTVAEHALSMMFYLNKKIHLFDDSVRQNNFNKLKFQNNNILTLNSELYEKSILIIGYGRIGKELAKRCQAFGMNILFFDPYVDEDSQISNLSAKKILDLEKGLSVADYVSIHMPLTNETKNLIDINKLKIMKKNSIIINTSRGGIINEKNLDDALNNNLIGGAGLDVFVNEPPETENPLLKNPKIVLTPHSAALTKECWKRMGLETIKNIIDFFNGNLSKEVLVNKDAILYKPDK